MSTDKRPQEHTPPSSRAGLGLALMVEQTMRLVYPERSPHDMHPGQWAALRFLARANREVRTVLGLARYLGVTQGPASRAVGALERKGLVAGERDARDRRVIRLSLTEAGSALLQSDPILRLARLIDDLPDPQRAVMVEGVSALFEGLSAAPEDGDTDGRGLDAFRLDDPDVPASGTA